MVTAGVRLGLSILAGVALVTAATAFAAETDFVGASACGKCHEEIYAGWKRTRHAAAAGSLKDSSGSRRCQSCHTTGDAPAGAGYFSGVQCEACHGAGAGYAPDDVMRDPKLARALGLRDLSTPTRRAALCKRCHRAGTRLRAFDPENAWKSIAHGGQP